MKKILSAAAVMAGIVLAAAEPVLYCDYVSAQRDTCHRLFRKKSGIF